MAAIARHTRLLAPLAALVALLVLPAGAFAGGILHVDASSGSLAAGCGSAAEPCATISDALTHVAGGEQVLVAPGEYPGATITRPVHLVGPAAGSARIRGTLVVQADASIDGLDFDDIAGPAIQFGATLPDAGSGASVVSNNTFTNVHHSYAIVATARMTGLRITGNRFIRGDASTSGGVFAHGELAGGIDDAIIERNVFSGFVDAAIDAGGVPGLQVARNTATGVGSLLMVSDSDGSAVRLRVHDNAVVDSGDAGAVLLGRGVHAITIDHNRFHGGAGSALLFDDSRGDGSTDDVQLVSNDIVGFGSAIRTDGNRGSASMVARGNRMVDVQRSGLVIDSASVGSIVDARGNWWGRSAGPAAGATRGTVDVSLPLRLVGVDAPASVYVSGSGVVAVRLVGAAGTAPETAADGFAITFGSSAAAVDAPTVKLVKGRASTFLTAGAAAGSTVTTATLDSETVSATTRIIATGGGAIDDEAAAPSVADARPRPVSRYVARSAFLKRTLRFSLSKGFRQAVATNRHASVRTTYMISHYDARAMRLRPVTNYTHRPFVIARVRTRAIRGSRIVTAPVNARPAFAIKRANRRVAVHVLSVIRTADGKVRRGSSRLVLPADAL